MTIAADISIGVEIVGDLPDIKLEALQGRLMEISSQGDAGDHQRADKPYAGQPYQTAHQRVLARQPPPEFGDRTDNRSGAIITHRSLISSCSGLSR